jgi:cytoskeletal protein CcmA (bactofilin family)
VPDLIVKEGTTAKLGRVDGDLKVGRNARITAESGRKVVVAGTAHFDGRVTIDCDFECQAMRLEGRGWGPGGDVLVDGDLEVHDVADIDASLRVTGRITAGDLDVGGHLRSGPLKSKRLRVGGHLETRGKLESGDVDVGGHMTVRDEVALSNLRVGGHAKIGGGTIEGEVKVRGHLTTEKPLAFGSVQVYGHTTLPAGTSGDRLSAYGRVEFEGDADCKNLEVAGDARVRGDCNSDDVEVKGRLNVTGRMHVSRKFRVFGAADARGAIECGALGVSGRLAAERISASDKADVVGEVNTSRGLKSASVAIGKGSKVTGPLIGDQIEVGKEMDFGSAWGLPWWRGALGRTTTVDDVYGKTVRIGSNSRAKRVFGDIVELENGSIAEEVNYTKEVKLPTNYYLNKPPVKMAKVPDPLS